jgi:hypothetical protein
LTDSLQLFPLSLFLQDRCLSLSLRLHASVEFFLTDFAMLETE